MIKIKPGQLVQLNNPILKYESFLRLYKRADNGLLQHVSNFDIGFAGGFRFWRLNPGDVFVLIETPLGKKEYNNFVKIIFKDNVYYINKQVVDQLWITKLG